MKKLFITIGVSFVFIVATSVQSSAENLIYGCYKKQNGQLRIVSNPSECRPSEVPISWNQAGEQVPPEPQGLTGVPEKNIYDQAYELFRQEKYDEVISSLVGYCRNFFEGLPGKMYCLNHASSYRPIPFIIVNRDKESGIYG